MGNLRNTVTSEPIAAPWVAGDSATQPFIIGLTIPMALVRTFVGFYFLNISISFTAMIGFISLMGIVVNDAIVTVKAMD